MDTARGAGAAAGSASAVEASAFEIDRSFQILFMIIIGGLGSILGSFIGTAFIFLLLILVDNSPRLVGSISRSIW